MTIEQIIILTVIFLIGFEQACEIRYERKRVNRLLDNLYKRVEQLDRKIKRIKTKNMFIKLKDCRKRESND